MSGQISYSQLKHTTKKAVTSAKMVKLIVALSLLVCEVNAFQNLGARVNELEAQAEVMQGLVQCLSEATAPHCDETCADVIAISSRPFPTIESGTSYEVDGCVEIKIFTARSC